MALLKEVATMSKASKLSLGKLWACRILNWLLMLGPLMVAIVLGYGTCGETGNTAGAVALTGTIVVCLILMLVNVLMKHKLRCVIWIMVLGLYFALDNIMPLVLCFAGTSIIDDLVLSPLVEHYKIEYTSNRAMDRRGVGDIA